MPAERKVKCPGCGAYFYKKDEPHIALKNRYWHQSCYDNFKSKEDQSKKDIIALEKYICELFNIDFVNARIQKQIKNMISQYHFTYSGILGTLKYWYEVKNNSIEKANGGIGIVPYVYEDAKKHYETIFYAQQSNKGLKKDSFIIKEKSIIIKPPKQNKRIKTIDLELLIKEVFN